MERPDLFSFADELNRILPSIHREMIRRQIDEVHKGRITFQQLLILEFLERGRDAKMSAVARFMDVSTAAATGIIERLVRESYVERVYDKKDRRVIRVQLTAKGSLIVKKASQQRRNMVIKIFQRISKADRRSYLRILKQVKDILIDNGD